MHSTKFQNFTFKWKTKIKLRTIQNIKEQKIWEYNNDSKQIRTTTYMCMYNHTHIHIVIHTRDAHLHNWGRCDTIHWRYIWSSLQCNAIRYDSPLLRCSAIRFRFNTTQCDSMQYGKIHAMEKIWSLLFLLNKYIMKMIHNLWQI